MANYYETARTNYFQVKDLEKFKEWIKQFSNPRVEKGYHEDDGKICLIWDEDGYQDWGYDDDGNETEQSFRDCVGDYLTEDSIIVVMGAGNEKVRYVQGWAFAVNHKCECESISIDEIYTMAFQRWGDKVTITRAEY